MRPFFSFWLCLMAVVYPVPKFLIFKKTIQSDTINKIKQWHKVNQKYQNASISRILDTSPQGLISSIQYLEFKVKYSKFDTSNERRRAAEDIKSFLMKMK